MTVKERTSPSKGKYTVDGDDLVFFATILLLAGLALGILVGYVFGLGKPAGSKQAAMMASFRTSSGAEQTFYAAVCDIVHQSGDTVVRTPRGFVYDGSQGLYTRYDIYRFVAINNGDGTYKLVSARPVQAGEDYSKLDDASAC